MPEKGDAEKKLCNAIHPVTLLKSHMIEHQETLNTYVVQWAFGWNGLF